MWPNTISNSPTFPCLAPCAQSSDSTVDEALTYSNKACVGGVDSNSASAGMWLLDGFVVHKNNRNQRVPLR